MEKTNYSKKLEDWRWQEKRLEIILRDIRLKQVLKELYGDLDWIIQVDFNDALGAIVK